MMEQNEFKSKDAGKKEPRARNSRGRVAVSGMEQALLKPRNRRMRYIVGSADLDQRFPCPASRQCLLDLMGRQLRPATEPNPSCLSTFAPFIRASVD